MNWNHPRAVAAALACLLAASPSALAAADDYEFRLAKEDIPQGDGAVVAVTLIDKRTGSAVPDAVIFATRMDMEPGGMETMTSPLKPLPSTERGVYQFSTNLTMAGKWRLSLAAKVQGEAETIQSRLILKAVP